MRCPTLSKRVWYVRIETMLQSLPALPPEEAWMRNLDADFTQPGSNTDRSGQTDEEAGGRSGLREGGYARWADREGKEHSPLSPSPDPTSALAKAVGVSERGRLYLDLLAHPVVVRASSQALGTAAGTSPGTSSGTSLGTSGGTPNGTAEPRPPSTLPTAPLPGSGNGALGPQSEERAAWLSMYGPAPSRICCLRVPCVPCVLPLCAVCAVSGICVRAVCAVSVTFACRMCRLCGRA